MADERLEIAARDWTLAGSDTTWRLSAHAAPIGFDLILQPLRAAVFIGGDGALTRGEATGRNGYRYALPRMATYGRLTVGADTLAVTGISWFDHYWGDGLIETDENGWTFLDLQLRDGAELTVYRIERARGGGHGRCGGVYVSPSGVGVPLDSDQVRFYAMGADRWRSPKSNVRYPVAWRIEIPSLMFSLRVTTRVPSQELPVAGTHGFSLWRGSVEADGRRGNQKVVGAGFLEVTGLDGPFPPPLFGLLASLPPSR
jgi:predicted secreted hydrolase